MKMADGVVRTEDLAWLGAQAAGARPGERIVSLCHYPLNKDLTNRQEVVATLKRLGITASLYGHYHRLDLRNFDGIAGIPGRALAGQAGRGAGIYPARFLRRLGAHPRKAASDTPHAPAIRYAWRGIRRYSPCPATRRPPHPTTKVAWNTSCRTAPWY